MVVFWVWWNTAHRLFLHAVIPALSQYPDPPACKHGSVLRLGSLVLHLWRAQDNGVSRAWVLAPCRGGLSFSVVAFSKRIYWFIHVQDERIFSCTQ